MSNNKKDNIWDGIVLPTSHLKRPLEVQKLRKHFLGEMPKRIIDGKEENYTEWIETKLINVQRLVKEKGTFNSCVEIITQKLAWELTTGDVFLSTNGKGEPMLFTFESYGGLVVVSTDGSGHVEEVFNVISDPLMAEKLGKILGVARMIYEQHSADPKFMQGLFGMAVMTNLDSVYHES